MFGKESRSFAAQWKKDQDRSSKGAGLKGSLEGTDPWLLFSSTKLTGQIFGPGKELVKVVRFLFE